MSREEHLAWSKKRALAYLDAGDLKNAFTSMGSDLMKHEDYRGRGTEMLMQVGLLRLMNGDARGLREWIEGFN